MEIYLGAILSFSAMTTIGVGDYLAKLASIRIGSIKTSFYVRFLGLIPPVLVIIFQSAFEKLDYASVDLGSLLIFGTIVGTLMSITHLVYYRGLEIGSVPIVTTVTSAWVAVSVVLAIIFLGETPTVLHLLIISIIVAGIGIVSGFRVAGFSEIISSNRTSGFSNGIICMLTAGAMAVLAKPMVEAAGPFIASTYTHILSSLFLFALIRWRGISLRFSIKDNLKYVAGAAFLTATGLVCLFLAILISPIMLVTPIVAAHPLITITCARVFEGGRTSGMQNIGIILTVGGIILLGLMG